MDPEKFGKIAKRLRYHILRITHNAGSGHPTSSFSSVDLAAVLFFKHLRYDLGNPDNPANDRVIFSKGHASALLYSLFALAGRISDEELISYRQFKSPLEGHPTMHFRYTEAATGSLGQGLSVGAGEAFAVKRNAKLDTLSPDYPFVYVLMGDGELAEGSVWEAAAWASFHKLSHLIAICDINRLGQSDETMYGTDVDVYQKRFEAFGWETVLIDGHNFTDIDRALSKASEERGKPFVILAKTIKGKGIPYWEDKNGWHNTMLPPDVLKEALQNLTVEGELSADIQSPDRDLSGILLTDKGSGKHEVKPESYEKGSLVATKKAFGNAIEKLAGPYPNLMVLDGDVANSLHTDQLKKSRPGQFLEMYIAEQNMVGVAVGLSRMGFQPFVTTFAGFLSRAADQIRMIHLSGATVYFNGSYTGVSVGHDGPSQMGLSDIAQFRSLPDSTVLYPSDPYATEYLIREMLKEHGVVYLRTTREPTPVIYASTDTFPVGGSKVWQSQRIKEHRQEANMPLQSRFTLVTIITAGITVHEALKAQKTLEDAGVAVQVIDCYSVKPIDALTLKNAAMASSAIVVAEDHYPEGGLGDAVFSALTDFPHVPIRHLAVRKVPMSGSPQELLQYEDLDAAAMVKTVQTLVR